MGAVWMRARAEMRSRWRAWLVLGVLLGLAGGVALTTAAGARRTQTAFDRLVVATKAHDLIVQENDLPDPTLLDRIEHLPQVAVAGRFATIPADVATDPDAKFAWSVTAGATADDDFGTRVAVPVLRAGRRANQADPDEAMVSPDFLRTRGLKLGDRFTIRTPTFDELLQLFGGSAPKPTGPTLTVRIVGVGAMPDDVGFTEENKGLIFYTRAFYEAYRDKFASLEISFIRLRHGARDLPAFSEAAARLAGGAEKIGIETRVENVAAQAHDALQAQSVALWVFALVVGLAAMLLIGQALVRVVSLAGDDNQIHRALGASRSGLIGGALVLVTAVAAIGAVIAVVSAVPGSASMPIGFARALEPSRGIRFDPIALGVGGLGVFALIWSLGAIAAVWTTRPSASAARRSPSAIAAAFANAGGSPAMVSGSRFAFEPGQGRQAVPIRGVLVGIVAGIIAITAAVTFDASFRHLLAVPSAYGWNWDAVVAGGEDASFIGQSAQKLTVSKLVSEYATVTTETLSFRHSDLTSASTTSGKGDVAYRMVEGRAPRRNDEVALGAITMRAAHVRIGDDIEFSGRSCPKNVDPCVLRFHITGRVLFFEEDGRPGIGAYFTPQGQARLASTNGFSDGLVRLAPGASVSQLRKELGLSEGELIAPRAPADVQNLGRARGLNRGLTIILALIAFATIAIALLTSASRRAHDLAILKVLGFVRPQVSRTVAWQATLLTAAALIIGVPLGVIAGRWLWDLVANRIAVAVEPVVPVAALAVGALGALALANLIALWPSRRAARTPPALVLRTE